MRLTNNQAKHSRSYVYTGIQWLQLISDLLRSNESFLKLRTKMIRDYVFLHSNRARSQALEISNQSFLLSDQTRDNLILLKNIRGTFKKLTSVLRTNMNEGLYLKQSTENGVIRVLL